MTGEVTLSKAINSTRILQSLKELQLLAVKLINHVNNLFDKVVSKLADAHNVLLQQRSILKVSDTTTTLTITESFTLQDASITEVLIEDIKTLIHTSMLIHSDIYLLTAPNVRNYKVQKQWISLCNFLTHLLYLVDKMVKREMEFIALTNLEDGVQVYLQNSFKLIDCMNSCIVSLKSIHSPQTCVHQYDYISNLYTSVSIHREISIEHHESIVPNLHCDIRPISSSRIFHIMAHSRSITSLRVLSDHVQHLVDKKLLKNDEKPKKSNGLAPILKNSGNQSQSELLSTTKNNKRLPNGFTSTNGDVLNKYLIGEGKFLSLILHCMMQSSNLITQNVIKRSDDGKTHITKSAHSKIEQYYQDVLIKELGEGLETQLMWSGVKAGNSGCRPLVLMSSDELSCVNEKLQSDLVGGRFPSLLSFPLQMSCDTFILHSVLLNFDKDFSIALPSLLNDKLTLLPQEEIQTQQSPTSSHSSLGTEIHNPCPSVQATKLYSVLQHLVAALQTYECTATFLSNPAPLEDNLLVIRMLHRCLRMIHSWLTREIKYSLNVWELSKYITLVYDDVPFVLSAIADLRVSYKIYLHTKFSNPQFKNLVLKIHFQRLVSLVNTVKPSCPIFYH